MLHAPCISKSITHLLTYNAEVLDIPVPIYNLSEYSANYSVTSRNLWNYCRDEVADVANENSGHGDYKVNNNKATTSRSFEWQKSKVIGLHQIIIAID